MRSPIRYTFLLMVSMLAMTGWAMVIENNQFLGNGNWLLLLIATIGFALDIWTVIKSEPVIE